MYCCLPILIFALQKAMTSILKKKRLSFTTFKYDAALFSFWSQRFNVDLAKNMDSEGNSDGPVVFVIDSVTFTASFYGWFFPF